LQHLSLLGGVVVGRLPLPRVRQVRFWEGIRSGRAVSSASYAAGVSHTRGYRWLAEAGGVIGNAPGELGDRYLSVAEREEISLGLARGESLRAIARGLGRPVSTVSREVARNGGRAGYRAYRG
jgi:transposase, IS30 family